MGSILGNRVHRVEDPRLLTGGGTYVEDLACPSAAWLTYVRSPVRATPASPPSTSRRQGGCPACWPCFTGADLAELGLAPHVIPTFPEAMRRPFVADGTVRFVGEPVVAVIAETAPQAADAADLVVVDYEPLPAVIDPEAAATRRGAAVPRGRDERRACACPSKTSGRLHRLRGRREPSGSSTSA